MKIIIKYLDKIQEFENQNTIVIGNNDSCNFFIEELKEETTLKLIYTQKYNNYVLVNSNNDKEILLNNKSFSNQSKHAFEIPLFIYFFTNPK